MRTLLSKKEPQPQCQPQPLPKPRTPTELRSLVRNQTPPVPCNCDLCQPSRYNHITLKCPKLIHRNISLQETTNSYGNTVFSPLRLASYPPGPLTKTLRPRYNEMHLARTVAAYINRPESHLNDLQLDAVRHLRRWIIHRGDILTPTKSKDGEKLLPAPEMSQLWSWFNSLFFAGDIPNKIFRWNPKLRDSNAVATGGLRGGHPCIDMDPLYDSRMISTFPDYWILEFISSLLHEAIHVFQTYYGCSLCRTAIEDDYAAGHGWVFNIIGAAIEEACPRLLGIPVDLGRFQSLVAGWETVDKLPSACDLEGFEFEMADMRLDVWARKAERAARARGERKDGLPRLYGRLICGGTVRREDASGFIKVETGSGIVQGRIDGGFTEEKKDSGIGEETKGRGIPEERNNFAIAGERKDCGNSKEREETFEEAIAAMMDGRRRRR